MFDFKDLCNTLTSETFIKTASNDTGYEYELLKNYIHISIEEAKYTLKIIDEYELKNKKILEFGAGLGIASTVLAINGYNITSFEPGGLGFEKNYLVHNYIKNYFNIEFDLFNNINNIKENSFDFIFSNNVLEHISNIEEITLHLDLSLSKNGIMVHNVPNYIIPYEPHFAILFCPIFPKKMSFLIPQKIRQTNLWASINFINIFDINKYAKKTNAKVIFKKHTMYDAIQRTEKDKEFSKRHITISKVINILRKIGVIELIKHLPTSLNTPIIYEWRKQ